ncbi:hypothetical protein AB0K21_21880 [Streptosporangium sp. NPDC049248]|uniref:hypothetical protein n=1 Tax=Streptosporangium sp. NPDC049248 TaxID=3155651 RepID=UPI003434B751
MTVPDATDVPVTQFASNDTPMGIALGSLGVLALAAIGVAIWAVRRNAKHSPSRKQKRKRKRDTSGDDTVIA